MCGVLITGCGIIILIVSIIVSIVSIIVSIISIVSIIISIIVSIIVSIIILILLILLIILNIHLIFLFTSFSLPFSHDSHHSASLHATHVGNATHQYTCGKRPELCSVSDSRAREPHEISP